MLSRTQIGSLAGNLTAWIDRLEKVDSKFRHNQCLPSNTDQIIQALSSRIRSCLLEVDGLSCVYIFERQIKHRLVTIELRVTASVQRFPNPLFQLQIELEPVLLTRL